MKRTVPKESASLRTEMHLMRIIWPKIWPTDTPKDSKGLIMRGLFKQTIKRRGITKNLGGHAINQINSRLIGLIPEF